MKTSDFDYYLPNDRIAQEPARPRDRSRLMVLHRKTGAMEHRHFYDLQDYLRDGDLLVRNNSKVFNARLKTDDGREIFLLRPDGAYWQCLLRPGKRFAVGENITLTEDATATLIAKTDKGTATVDFQMPSEDVIALADTIGEIPLPPYIDAGSGRVKADAYQTVYAKETGSVAAPTAGFHFTPELIAKLEARGIRFADVTLHVGLGTFRPVNAEAVEDHVMHEEWVDVPERTQTVIADTKRKGGRVIAVGTTTIRALESGIRHGWTNIFIKPGYRFNTIDGLITNFHLPRSSLLILVSAFAGRGNIRRAYDEAVARGYRFYSFGDAMLIV